MNSVERFQNRKSVEYGTIVIVITAVLIVTKEILSQIAFFIGRKTDNVIIKQTAGITDQTHCHL